MPFDTVSLAELPEVSDVLLRFANVRVRIASRSMAPTLLPGDEIIVEPASIDDLRAGDLILFRWREQLICHRLVDVSGDAVVTRGDAASAGGERTDRDQVLGKVVKIRKRAVHVALCETLGPRIVPVLLRWLPRLQGLRAYRPAVRPLFARRVSYYLGIARGARWYDWRECRIDERLPILARTERPYLVIAKAKTRLLGWCELTWRDSAWHCENLCVRLLYRRLGLESDLARLARCLTEANGVRHSALRKQGGRSA
jgi:signal peptidase I